MKRFLSGASIGLSLALVLTACSSTGRTAPSPFDGSTRSGSGSEGTGMERVQVVNNAFEDATVYALDRNQRIRAGNVPGNAERTLDFRWSPNRNRIRFEIDFLAGPTCRTDELPMNPGDVLVLRLPANPSRTRGCL